jgi:RNA polymerase sigma-54 factor
MALHQNFQQGLLQRLSPQQIQLMKLLQVPTAILDERIKEEMEENPALEQADDGSTEDEYLKDEFTENNEEEFEADGSEEEYDNIDISEYVQDGDDEVGDYRLKDENYPEIDEGKTTLQKVEVSFNELMLQQLGLLNLNEKDTIIAEYLVGSLEDDGYLRRDTNAIINDLAFRQNIDAAETEINELLLQIQQFDPAGVGARSLQECLLLQLQRKTEQGVAITNAIKVITQYFDEFTKKHYEKIKKSLVINDEQLREIIQQIVKLNPKPGGAVAEGEKNANYVIPDFFISNTVGKLELVLNSKNAPDLRISEGYRDMLTDYERGTKKDKNQRDAVQFIKQKIDSAKWFIDAIKQRQHTLYSTMDAIMQYQKNFFTTGDETELRPMILKDIAEKTNLDISTVSRVANSKFVQTEFGTYKLKFFFSESLQTDSGEEVSTREVKKILTNFISEESNSIPYSDEKLTEMLQEKGYNIARRTVAKYREQLNIPVARLRKKI